MKQTRNHPVFQVTKKAQRSIENNHPWVYDAEILNISGEYNNGDIADVVGEKGNYLGSGFISEKSKIRVRLISRNANDTFDGAFWKRRIGYAWEYRKTVMGRDISSCRVIFGEADGFPGLTVDKFENILVTQTLSYGMEQIKDVIFPALLEATGCDAIYERNDVAIRELEGLSQGKGWYGDKHPDSTSVIITENSIKYNVDFENGQKTGYFLDQKYNRLAVSRLAKGKKVLDCFTHTGSFAFNAVMGGAAHVTAIDISENAIENAKNNAKLNGFGDVLDFRCENVFDLLPALEASHKSDYDFIILDPPAFTKSRKTIDSASRGYKEINYRAMKLLPRGGYLATCSCSHFMEEQNFVKMLHSAAADASVELKRIEERQQAPDHPVLMNVPETDYLKFFLFQVI